MLSGVTDHVFRIHDLLQLFLAQDLFLSNEFDNTFACFLRFRGKFGRFVVTYVWVKRCDESDTALEVGAADLL